MGTTQTDDTEIRGSFRCGSCSGFYRGPHPESNACGPLPETVLIAMPARRVPCSTLRRPPQSAQAPQCDPITTTTSHPALPDLSGPPVTAADPSSSCLPSSCPAPPAHADPVQDVDRSADLPETQELQNHSGAPIPRPACLSPRALPYAAALPTYSRESAFAPDPAR